MTSIEETLGSHWNPFYSSQKNNFIHLYHFHDQSRSPWHLVHSIPWQVNHNVKFSTNQSSMISFTVHHNVITVSQSMAFILQLPFIMLYSHVSHLSPTLNGISFDHVFRIVQPCCLQRKSCDLRSNRAGYGFRYGNDAYHGQKYAWKVGNEEWVEKGCHEEAIPTREKGVVGQVVKGSARNGFQYG